MALTGILAGFNDQRGADTNYLAQIDAMRRAAIAQEIDKQRMAEQKQQFAQELMVRQQQSQQSAELERARMAQQGQQQAQDFGLRSQEFGLRNQAAQRSMAQEDAQKNFFKNLAGHAGDLSDEDLGRAILPYNQQVALGLIKEARTGQRDEAKNQALLARTGGTGIAADKGYRWTDKGTQEFIPGGPADPANLAAKAELSGKASEDERKAAGWLAQATNSYNNMANVMQTSPDASGPGLLESVASGLGAQGIANTLRSPDRQRFVQAASSFAEAALRAATGAGVNKEEAIQKIQELTPLYTDDLPNRQQKLDSMKVYLDSLTARAGRADTSFIPERGDIGTLGKQSATTFSSLPDPRQYVGKTVMNPDTGMRMTSNGRDWLRAK